MITYYRGMWPRHSNRLAPFTNLSGLPKKSKIVWNDELSKSFKQVRAVIVQDALMAYPNHNLPFGIHTDSPDYHLGAGGRTVA